MIKKIRVEQLRPGMYVHDFNCSWIEHPFLSNSVLLKSEKDVQKVVGFGIRELYIDTSKGSDVGDAPTMEEAHIETREEMHRVFEWTRSIINPVSVTEEISKAKRVKHEAKIAIHDIMGEVKMGRQVEVEQAEHVVEKMVDSIFRNVDALTSLSRIKQADQYLFMHSVNVCVLMISFCRFMGIDREVVQKVGVGALLHDIGKMKVPQAVLNKTSKLTDSEFLTMQKHVTFSRAMLVDSPGIPGEAVDVAYEHHERYDGAGYPNRLKGDAISRFGQMASIADVYDAITSDRVYHKGMEPAEAIRKIFEWSKHHFNEELAHWFIKCVGIYPVGTLVRLESGLLAVVAEPGQTSILHPLVRAVYDSNKNRLLVHPVDIDLAKPDCADRIVSYDNPELRGINPLDYLNLHGIF